MQCTKGRAGLRFRVFIYCTQTESYHVSSFPRVACMNQPATILAKIIYASWCVFIRRLYKQGGTRSARSHPAFSFLAYILLVLLPWNKNVQSLNKVFIGRSAAVRCIFFLPPSFSPPLPPRGALIVSVW